MKKSVLIIVSLGLILGFASCKKEVIEIVNDPDEVVVFNTKDGVVESDNYDNVTDPDEEEDFEKDEKSDINNGK